LSIVIAIVALCVIILIHEIGHFAAGKLFKMNVYQFNLGMGPILLKKNYRGTQYGLRLFPIGGSCVFGEDETESSDDPNEFRNKPVWQRIIVIVAGAVLNLLLGLVLCIIINSVFINDPDPKVGVPTMTVSAFREGSVSNTGTCALHIGDRIVSVNGMRIISHPEISFKMNNSLTKTGDEDGYAVYEFVVIRNGEKAVLPNVKFAVHRDEDGEIKVNERGGMTYIMDFAVLPVENTALKVLEYSVRDAVGFGRIIWLSLIEIFRGTYGLNEIGGPVQIVGIFGEVTENAIDIKAAVMSILRLSALITINLGIMNLLPIPALDGGRLIFLTVEGIRRKPLKAEVEGMIHFVGFALLMLLILVVTFNDIRKLIFGG